MINVTKIWLTDDAVWIRTAEGREACELFDNYPRLKYATREQRANYIADKYGITWPDIDEDLSYEGFFIQKEQTELQRLFINHPELNVSAIARRMGISQSLFAQYISGLKKPSKERMDAIYSTIHEIGSELLDKNRTSRIGKMEEIYDRVQKDIATLKEYEESGLWLKDYEADERGELPHDLKRGVLSQDGLDEVFEEAKTITPPPRKYPVITLCGSTRFKEQYLEAQKRLTLAGNIVISVGLFGHSGDDEVWTDGTKEMLDDMHKRKIDMADEIFVINVGGYIGESTRSEIEYAKQHGKAVRYLERV